MTKTVQYQNELHKFLIWDTAGQERVRSYLFLLLCRISGFTRFDFVIV